MPFFGLTPGMVIESAIVVVVSLKLYRCTRHSGVLSGIAAAAHARAVVRVASCGHASCAVEHAVVVAVDGCGAVGSPGTRRCSRRRRHRRSRCRRCRSRRRRARVLLSSIGQPSWQSGDAVAVAVAGAAVRARRGRRVRVRAGVERAARPAAAHPAAAHARATHARAARPTPIPPLPPASFRPCRSCRRSRRPRAATIRCHRNPDRP